MALKDWRKVSGYQDQTWFKKGYPKKRFETGEPVVVKVYKGKFLDDKGWFVAVDKDNVGTSLYEVDSPFKTKSQALTEAKSYMQSH